MFGRGGKKTWLLFLVVPLVLLLAWPALGCTLWGAAGDSVAGGGVLAAKTRDWSFKHPQTAVLITPDKGFRFFGLYEGGNEKSGVKMGLNEKGLFVASATSSIPAKERRAMPETKDLNRKLLESSASVAQALAKTDLFLGPRYLILADPKEIAVVEIGPGGRHSIRRTPNGVLGHTNHYLDPEMTKFNPSEIKPSTLARHDQIAKFLESKPALGLDDFIAVARSKDAGPDNSIWRDGSKPKGTRTLAYWIIHYPPQGRPTLHARVLQPGGKEVKDYTYPLDRIFAPAK